MKKYLIVLIVFILVCSVQSDNVRIVWNDNPEADRVTNYIIYIYQGSDSTNTNMVPIDTIPDIWTGGQCQYIFDFDSLYIRASVQAGNSVGYGEPSDTTRAFYRGELFVPGKVNMATMPIIGN